MLIWGGSCVRKVPAKINVDLSGTLVDCLILYAVPMGVIISQSNPTQVDSGRRVRGSLIIGGSGGQVDLATQMQVSSLWLPVMRRLAPTGPLENHRDTSAKCLDRPHDALPGLL